MQKIITTLLFIISFYSFAQEQLGEFENDLKKSHSFTKDIIPIVNSKNNEIAVFISDAKNIYGYKLNTDFKVISKISFEEKRRKFTTSLGYKTYSNGDYKIALTNLKRKKILFTTFSFSNQKTTFKEFELPYKHKIIQTVSTADNFYLITAKPFDDYINEDGSRKKESEISFNDDIINIYSFSINDYFVKKELNFSQNRFYDKNGDRVKIRSLLFSDFQENIPKINNDFPTSIDIAADLTKLYSKNNTDNIIFSFDVNKALTQILEINLKTNQIKLDFFEKKFKKSSRSNSYIQGNHIYIASANKDQLILQIIDYKNKKIIKEFNIYKDKDINFKNTPIIQQGGGYEQYRELESSKKFLRKITASKFGISTLKNGDYYQLSIGGYKSQQSGGTMMMSGMGGFGGIPIGSIGCTSFFFNPTMFAYNASKSTKSTQIDCLLNENFEHIKGDIPENSFDKIDGFLDNSENDFIEVFKLKNQTILGSYHKHDKKYYFYKF